MSPGAHRAGLALRRAIHLAHTARRFKCTNKQVSVRTYCSIPYTGPWPHSLLLRRQIKMFKNWQKVECHIFILHCMRIHKGYGHIWHCCRQTFGHPLSTEKIQHFLLSCFLVPCHNSSPFVWKFEKIVYILWQLFVITFLFNKNSITFFLLTKKIRPRYCAGEEKKKPFQSC